MPPKDTINKDEAYLMQLKNNVTNYVKKIEDNKDLEKEEKLQIFRRQVDMIEQKKEDLKDCIKNLDLERVNLEMEIGEKKTKLEETEGSDYLNREEFQKF